MVELQSDAEYQDALKQLAATKSSAVIDFAAAWCAPCKMVAPYLEQLAADFPAVRFYKIDIDNQVGGRAGAGCPLVVAGVLLHANTADSGMSSAPTPPLSPTPARCRPCAKR